MKTSHPLLLTSSVLLYATSYPLGALTLHGIGPFWLIAVRFAIGAALMWPIVCIRGWHIPRGRTLLITLAAGILVQGVQFLGAYWAMSHGVSAAVTALIIALNPAVTAVLGRLIFGNGGTSVLAVVLATLAVLVACVPRVMADPRLGPAIGTAVVALLGLSIGSVVQGRFLADVEPPVFAAVGMTASFPLALGLAAFTSLDYSGGLGTAALIVLGSITGLVGSTIYAGIVRRGGAISAAMLFAVIPAVAALVAWPMLGEVPSVTVAAAVLIGALAVVLHVRTARQPRAEEPSPIAAPSLTAS